MNEQGKEKTEIPPNGISVIYIMEYFDLFLKRTQAMSAIVKLRQYRTKM